MEKSKPVAVEDEDDRAGSSDAFMLHVVLVLVVTWLVSALRMNTVFSLCLCAGYLWLVEKRSRKRERHRFGFEGRRELDKSKADEAETLRWLNEGLKNMWPVCMEKFASKHFFGPMVPWFLNTYKPKSVSRVMLQSLALGSTPPVFSFIRALEVPEDGDHVAFEAVMQFVSGNDMNAEISVQLIRGIWTTFYVSKLAIKGTAKISVKFVKGWPVVERVRLCFANPPDVTLTARPMYKKGMDMNSVPGAANWLEKTVDIALKQSVVKPNMLVVDIEKLVTNMMWPDPRPQKSKANSNGVPDFFYVENKSAYPPTVLVEILGATNLKAADSNGLSDPFVEVILGQHNWKTKTKYKTLNPTWTEHHRIPIVNWELPNLLTLRVQDWDFLKRPDELGMCSVDVKSYRDGARHEMQLPLEGEHVSTGQIRFAITVEMNNSGPQVLDELQNSGVGSQTTVSQEIQISPGSTSIHTPPSILRSSDSDSKSQASKNQLLHPSTEDSGLFSTVLEQNHTAECFELVEMPFWPSGSLKIQHPGSVERVGFPISKKIGSSGKKSKSSSEHKKKVDTENVKDHEDKPSRLGFLRRRKRVRGGASSQESLGNTDRESTVSDQSGYTSQGSLDGSIDLNNNVKMTVLSPENSHSPESHDMYVHPPAGIPLGAQLEPILSQNGGPKTPDPQYLDNTSQPDYETLVGGDKVTSGAQGLINESTSPTAQFEVDDVPAEPQQPLQAVSGNYQQPEIKQHKFRSLAWWKKLTQRAMRRKRRESKGLDFPQGLVDNVGTMREGEYNSCTSDQSGLTTPVTCSFRKDPNDLISPLAATSSSRPGESPELRKIITGSRASGSQSCRVDPVTTKQLINVAGGNDSRVSQSFRHDSLRINDSPHIPSRDSSLRTIPEKKLVGQVKPRVS